MDIQSHSFSYIKGCTSKNKFETNEMETFLKEAEQLRNEITKNSTKNVPEEELLSYEAEEKLPALNRVNLQNRKILRGHLSKVYAMQWSNDSRTLVSASQDGKMIVWDAHKAFKLFLVPLESAWVMTCAYSPSGNFIACGGLDNVCGIYSLKTREGTTRLVRVLSGHEAFIASCYFVDDAVMLTASGDKTCAEWNVEKSTKVRAYTGHTGGIMSISKCPNNQNIFVSGACDASAKLWDMRSGKSEHTFPGHFDDINDVKFFPSGKAFVSASDDGTCRLFDLVGHKPMAVYPISNASVNTENTEITSVDFSASGRLLFAGDNAFNCTIWDSMRQERVGIIAGHNQRVSCLGVARDGSALCTGSFDGLLKVWN